MKTITTGILAFFITTCISAQELFPFKNAAGLYGFYDVTGKIVVQPKYGFACEFSDGLACVTVGGDEYGGGMSGYIDRTGKEVIPATLVCYRAGDFKEGFALIDYGEYSYGFINKTGKELSTKRYNSAFDFSDGMAQVNIGYNGEANGLWGFIDKTGAEVVPLKYNGDMYGFADGLTPVANDVGWGFIDKTGRMVIAAKYSYAYNFSEGLAPVYMDKDFTGSMDEEGKENTWSFVDKTGKEITSFRFSVTGEFKCGRARVKQNGKWGYIDKTGTTVIDIKYEYVGNFCEDLAYMWIDKKVGFVSKEGKEVIPAIYSYISGEGFSEGLVAATIDDKLYGYIDKTGKTIIPFIYSGTSPFKGGRAAVTLNKVEIFIDKTGKEIIPY